MTDEPTHIATAVALLDDPYDALSQHLHGDGDAPQAITACATDDQPCDEKVRRLIKAAQPFADGPASRNPEVVELRAALAAIERPCATPGCTNRPVIRLDDRHLCRDCYATHDFGEDA